MFHRAYQIIFPKEKTAEIKEGMLKQDKRMLERWNAENGSYELLTSYPAYKEIAEDPGIIADHKRRLFELSEGYAREKFIVGSRACARCFNKNFWPSPWFTGRESFRYYKVPLILTEFECSDDGYFSLSIEYTFNGKIGGTNKKCHVPGEKVWRLCSDPGPTTIGLGMDFIYQNNIPAFFGIIERGDGEAYTEFSEKWIEIWSDEQLGPYETAKEIAEMLQFPLFYPEVSSKELVQTYSSQWTEILVEKGMEDPPEGKRPPIVLKDPKADPSEP